MIAMPVRLVTLAADSAGSFSELPSALVGLLLAGLAIAGLTLADGASADSAGERPFAAAGSAPGPAGKTITKFDDLPRHEYPIPGSVRDLLRSSADFAAFAAAVRADVENDLAAFQIEDAATSRQLLSVLIDLDLIEGRFDDALARLRQMRELEEKPAKRYTTGLIGEAIIAASREAGKGDREALRGSFRRHLEQHVAALPWDVVQDHVEAMKGQLEMLSENLIMGIVDAQIEKAVQSQGRASAQIAAQVISFQSILQVVLPVKDDAVAVLGAAVEAHRVEKPNIWPERSVTLEAGAGLAPVVVAIWDTGVDVGVFPDRLFVNPNERFDGQDSDGNGFVDDVHGIAYTLEHEKTPELLYPLRDAAPRVHELRDQIKGYFDMQSAIESPEAVRLRAKLAAMTPEGVTALLEEIGEYALYAHGTHVGGIAIDGNPFARILVARLTGDLRMVPRPPSVEDARRQAQEFREVIDYFRAHGVRVVNMSWVVARREIERDLELNGIGKDAEERAKLAGEIFDITRDALYDGIRSASEIVFVGGAGNSDDDVTFDEIIPPAFELPNLLAVGAVDQAGEPTGFTSFGKAVDVYANGFEVESFVPGGERITFSGTSMASPNAANLAAKLIALDPSLTPRGVLQLIRDGADRRAGEYPMLIINPKRSAELLEERRAKS
jgi:subtilisin family serine protease